VFKRLFRSGKGEVPAPPDAQPAAAPAAEPPAEPPPSEQPVEPTASAPAEAATVEHAAPEPTAGEAPASPALAAEPEAPSAGPEALAAEARDEPEAGAAEVSGHGPRRDRRGLLARLGFGRGDEAEAEARAAPGATAPAGEAPPPPAALVEAAPELPAEAEDKGERRGFLARLKAGLARSSAKIGAGIASLFRERLMDDAALDELEDLLITADLGTSAARRIVDRFRIARFGAHVSEREVKEALAAEIADILRPVARPLVPDPALAPHVVLVVGVNGTGKTTTIAKLAALWSSQGLKPMLVAGDTFRAAAVEQLAIWGERTGCPVIAGPPNADAAGLAYDALARARKEGADVLLIDTAGRLHNKADLMAELGKIVRVLRKQLADAPHSVLLVLDATTGQNALTQVKVFREMVEVTGLIVTKLDGSAKGGVVVALAETFGLPVHAVGVGEKAEDLRPFDADEFARSLVGLDEAA